jgi:hypothetical protein
MPWEVGIREGGAGPEQLTHDLAMLAPTGDVSRDEARKLVESVEHLVIRRHSRRGKLI